MTFDTSDVRVVRGDTASLPAYREQKQRTPQQRHTDDALESAALGAATGREQVIEALAWLESIGADVPIDLKALGVRLAQLETFVQDEKARRR